MKQNSKKGIREKKNKVYFKMKFNFCQNFVTLFHLYFALHFKYL